jgi:DNA repair protein RadC
MPRGQASFSDLQQVAGVGPSKAAAIRSAFLLAHRLVQEVNGSEADT